MIQPNCCVIIFTDIREAIVRYITHGSFLSFAKEKRKQIMMKMVILFCLDCYPDKYTYSDTYSEINTCIANKLQIKKIVVEVSNQHP